MEFVGQEQAPERKRQPKQVAAVSTGDGGARIFAFPGARGRGHRRLWAMLRRRALPASDRTGMMPEGLRVYRPASAPTVSPDEVASES